MSKIAVKNCRKCSLCYCFIIIRLVKLNFWCATVKIKSLFDPLLLQSYSKFIFDFSFFFPKDKSYVKTKEILSDMLRGIYSIKTSCSIWKKFCSLYFKIKLLYQSIHILIKKSIFVLWKSHKYHRYKGLWSIIHFVIDLTLNKHASVFTVLVPVFELSLPLEMLFGSFMQHSYIYTVLQKYTLFSLFMM